jgi:hypothetical protein
MEICSPSFESRNHLTKIDLSFFRSLTKNQFDQNSTILPVCISWESNNIFALRLGTW